MTVVTTSDMYVKAISATAARLDGVRGGSVAGGDSLRALERQGPTDLRRSWRLIRMRRRGLPAVGVARKASPH
jgi:hypothetical protein